MTSLYSNDPAIKQAQIDQDVADINNEIEYLEGFLALQNEAKQSVERYNDTFSHSKNFNQFLVNTISSTGTNFAYEIAFGEDSPYQSQVEHLQWLKERRYQLMLNLRPSDQEIARYNYFEQHHALLSGQVVELENRITGVRSYMVR